MELSADGDARQAARSTVAALLVASLTATPGCKPFTKGSVSEELSPQPPKRETVDGNAPVLKAHMEDGDVYLLRDWTIESDELVRGTGVKYDARREVDNRGVYAIPIQDVAIFETNVLKPSGGIIAMTVVTGLSLTLTGYCAANPKSCFGSCPTFYAGSKSVEGRRPMAEGFSHAIAPSLETTDVDALPRFRPTGERAALRMTNEAMETHVVRRLRLLAAERTGPGGRVFRTSEEEFRIASGSRPPVSCSARNGACLDALRQRDGTRWSSEADPDNLAARENLELEYRVADRGRVGLAITFRQTFVTTFLFYRFLSDLGSQAVDFLAELERSDGSAVESFRGITDLMGGIDIEIRRDGGWKSVGEVREAGPLADDTRLVVFPEPLEGRVDVRLRMAKGNWRIDAARLVDVGSRPEVHRLTPVSASYDGAHPEYASERPARRVRTQSETLVTRRGDAYTFRFELPAEPDRYEYFLESRGYYLEWMREKWLRESHPARAAQMLMWPSQALRTLAPAFKRHEPELEQHFWESRYVPSD